MIDTNVHQIKSVIARSVPVGPPLDPVVVIRVDTGQGVATLFISKVETAQQFIDAGNVAMSILSAGGRE